MDIELAPYALCLVQDVKDWLDTQKSTLDSHDERFATFLINGWSSALQGSQFLNRKLFLQDYEEVFRGDTGLLCLSAPPVRDVTALTLWEHADGLWDDNPDATLRVRDTDYEIMAEEGLVKSLLRPFVQGTRAVRVRYPGGLVKTEYDSIETSVDLMDLRMAVAEQVAFVYQNAKDTGAAVIPTASGDIRIADPGKIRPMLMLAIENHRRHEV